MVAAPRARWLLVTVAGLLAAGVGSADPLRSGFSAATLPASDDGSSAAVNLGFTVNFLGQTFSSLFVNTNGNLTFAAPLPDFTPVSLGQLPAAIVAPFFADADTTVAGTVSYGTGTVNGRPAFGATWNGVGSFGGTPGQTNTFQAVVVDRSDTGAGNFDTEFNYGKVAWESGTFNGGVNGLGGSSARAGASGGTGAAGSFYELPGSGVPGSFLGDASSPTGLASGMLNSDTAGRYVLYGRDGTIGPTLTGSPDPSSTPDPGTGTGGVLIPVDPGVIGVGAPEPGTLLLASVGGLGLGLVHVSRRLPKPRRRS